MQISTKKCAYCGNVMDYEKESLHDACKEFYEFFLNEVISKTREKLKICEAIQASFEPKVALFEKQERQ